VNRWLVLLTLALAACAQAQDYPAPVQALAAKGIAIKGTLPAPSGYRGFVGSYQGHAMPVYLLPDGKHTVVGTLFDEQGNDLTEGALQAAASSPLNEQTWAQLAKTRWIAEGAANPKRIVYVFTDTECPYCHKLWLATQPLLAKGDVQVRHILVAVIAPQSEGRAAAVLDAADPHAALKQHENAFGHSALAPEKSVPAATAKAIADNTALMDQLGISGTPATVYKDAEGKVRIANGMLPEQRLEAIFGS
jgi:thiol:disulfide interchange protein DsbG